MHTYWPNDRHTRQVGWLTRSHIISCYTIRFIDGLIALLINIFTIVLFRLFFCHCDCHNDDNAGHHDDKNAIWRWFCNISTSVVPSAEYHGRPCGHNIKYFLPGWNWPLSVLLALVRFGFVSTFLIPLWKKTQMERPAVGLITVIDLIVCKLFKAIWVATRHHYHRLQLSTGNCKIFLCVLIIIINMSACNPM